MPFNTVIGQNRKKFPSWSGGIRIRDWSLFMAGGGALKRNMFLAKCFSDPTFEKKIFLHPTPALIQKS
jgi:hypothetical protein